MIKNIIFDIGQVLAHFRWREYINDFGYTSEIKERLGKATVLSPYWNEIDRGVLSVSEIIDLCVSIDPGIECEVREFFKDTRNIVVEYDYAARWLKELKALGYHIFLLSNYGEVNFSHIKDKFQFFSYVDGAVISYQEKCIKPEKRIYQILLERYHLNPSESVFLDDLSANIEGAKNLGIHGIQFINYQQAKADLRKIAGMSVEGIIFDLDGTLWDSTEEAAQIWKEIASKNPAITDEITGPILKGLYGLPLEEIAVKLFLSVPKEVAIATMEECVVAQCDYLEQHKGKLLGAVEHTLKELKKHYKLFIVSNCKSGYIEAFLSGNQLQDYITDHECPGGTGKLKADNIRIIMERNQIISAIYVGDTMGDGIAAHEAGLDFIYANYGFGEATEYEYRIESLEELILLMQRVEEDM